MIVIADEEILRAGVLAVRPEHAQVYAGGTDPFGHNFSQGLHDRFPDRAADADGGIPGGGRRIGVHHRALRQDDPNWPEKSRINGHFRAYRGKAAVYIGNGIPHDAVNNPWTLGVGAAEINDHFTLFHFNADIHIDVLIAAKVLIQKAAAGIGALGPLGDGIAELLLAVVEGVLDALLNGCQTVFIDYCSNAFLAYLAGTDHGVNVGNGNIG